MQVQYVRFLSLLAYRHFESLVTRDMIEKVYQEGVANDGKIKESCIDYRQQIESAKVRLLLDIRVEGFGSDARIARSQLKIKRTVSDRLPKIDLLVSDYMYNHGQGRLEEITRLQAEVFSYAVHRSPMMKRDRRRFIFPKRGVRVFRPRPRDIGLVITADAYSFLLFYEPVWEEFVKFIPGRIVVVI